MSDSKRNLAVKTALLATAGAGILYVVLRSHILQRLRRAIDFQNPMRYKHIKIVETVDECQSMVNIIKRHCNTYKVLGFDCEWVTVGGTRRPVALLQLSTHEGLCALFRLSCMKHIPLSLRELLENEQLIKVGVGSQDDAQKLAQDYGVSVVTTFDLRFLAAITGNKPGGLGKLAKSLLNVALDKNWRLACSDWEAKILTPIQTNYAADDAFVAIEIFKKLAQELEPRSFWQLSQVDFSKLYARLEPFFDIRYKDGYTSNLSPIMDINASVISGERKAPNWQSRKQHSRFISTRSRTLYDNCLLEAPDGELLCTIDRKKAKWYLAQNLGVEIKAEPFTVRLNFEPAGRAVGEVGRYYQMPKTNQCVVCGRCDVYIRKNVVPREYRKHFPVVMKTHTSHDVLLLCPTCHQMSNISDMKIRMHLSKICEAPLVEDESASKSIEVPELRQVKSAARALLLRFEQIPQERRDELKQVVLKHYEQTTHNKELTQELLEAAANLETNIENENYCVHGLKVVQKFQTDFGGLTELEKLWRIHFLMTMQPKYLPKLWNINHNAERLEQRAVEGRIDEQDLIVAGVHSHVLNTTGSSTAAVEIIDADNDELCKKI